MNPVMRHVMMVLVLLSLNLATITPPDTAEASDDLEKLIEKIERRYDVPGFTADFHQVSTIKAMDISDEADGKIYVRKPEMMRWEYEKPDPQVIITNSEKLWIYRPLDNQVIIGRAPAFLAGGKGAGFLADIKVLRRQFEISNVSSPGEPYHTLKLVPLDKSADVADILLLVAKETYAVHQVVTYNAYGDETRITLLNASTDKVPEKSLFTFTIPEGADVVNMDEQQ